MAQRMRIRSRTKKNRSTAKGKATRKARKR